MCSDSGATTINQTDPNDAWFRYAAANNVYCSLLSPTACLSAPMCVSSLTGCYASSTLINGAYACANSPLEKIIACTKISTPLGCMNTTGCTWNSTCRSTSAYANATLGNTRMATGITWTCPELYGCCKKSDNHFARFTRCNAINMVRDRQGLNITATKGLCTSIPGCYYSDALYQCTGMSMDPFCNNQKTQTLCLTPKIEILSTLIMNLTRSSPPPELGGIAGATMCSYQRMHPDAMTPFGACDSALVHA